MILEGVGPPNVPDHRPRVPVARLVHDAGEIRTPFGGGRDVASPQGVCSEGRGIKASRLCVSLDDVGHGLGCEAWLLVADLGDSTHPP